VSHYFFEGADRVYTPMLVEEGHIYWNYPEWVRDPVPTYAPEDLYGAIAEHVPAGASAAIATHGEDPPLEDREFSRFSLYDVEDEESDDLLAKLKDEGADYVVFPREVLGHLEWNTPSLQEALERGSQSLFRDGAVGAIYRLSPA
jgi:hypothetical protein